MTRIDGRILRTIRATISITEAGPMPLFPTDSKRLQYAKIQLNSKDGIVRKVYCRVAFVTVVNSIIYRSIDIAGFP